MTATSPQAWYVYSILPATADAPVGDGVLPGAPIQAVSCETLTVLASLVPRALFDSTSALNRTADPDWMAARIEAHHAVNVAATGTGPCLPMAFGSLFSSLDLLRQWLVPRAPALHQALSRIAGQTEWTVSLREDAAAHAAWLDGNDPQLRTTAHAAALAAEGTAFLMARRLDKLRTSARAAHIDKTAAIIAVRLAEAGFNVLNEGRRSGLPSWTVLVADRGGFVGVAQAIDNDFESIGLSLHLSGPWPVYAFAREALKEAAHD